jgi:hypothetical protein
MRSGPLALTRVTVVEVIEGRPISALFGIGTVEARWSNLIGPTGVRNNQNDMRSRATHASKFHDAQGESVAAPGG